VSTVSGLTAFFCPDAAKKSPAKLKGSQGR